MDKYVIISAIVAGIVTWLFMYLDARLFDTPKTKFTYFKGIVFVSTLVATIVYFMKPGSASAQLGAGAGAVGASLPPVTSLQPATMNDMLHGLPPF